MRLRHSLGVLGAALSLAACSTFSGDEPQLAAPPDMSAAMEARVADLETENTRLKSENARLANKLMELQRENEELTANGEAPQQTGEERLTLAEAKPQETPTLTAPSPQANQDAVVDDPAAPELAESDVPVASSPRLVQPTFTSTDAVFENEANGDIETKSVLFGVHLASYRQLTEAREGWRKLQRENPDELGLLEPRIETVDLPEKGVFLRLIGGGFSSEEKAAALCANLAPKGVYCSVSGFVGEKLSLGELR